MRILTKSATWGWVLIAGGILFLLENLNLLPGSGWIWVGAFGAVGLLFLVSFFQNRDQWWTAFPAFGLLGIAGTIVISELLPGSVPDEYGGAFFIGLLGLSFFMIYLRTREHWWPIIPGGALLTVGGIILITGVESLPEGPLVALVLFGGMALTFGLLLLLPSAAGRPRWAIWPALGLLLPALISAAGVMDLFNYILPAVLILAGGYILVRSFK